MVLPKLIRTPEHDYDMYLYVIFMKLIDYRHCHGCIVLKTTAQCVRDKIPQEQCKEITFSLIFYFTVYDVTKKALYGWNMLNHTKTFKKNFRYYSRDYCLGFAPK